MSCLESEEPQLKKEIRQAGIQMQTNQGMMARISGGGAVRGRAGRQPMRPRAISVVLIIVGASTTRAYSVRDAHPSEWGRSPSLMTPENMWPDQDEARYESVGAEPLEHLDTIKPGPTYGNDFNILSLESKMHPTSADGEVITGPAVSDHDQPLNASHARMMPATPWRVAPALRCLHSRASILAPILMWDLHLARMRLEPQHAARRVLCCSRGSIRAVAHPSTQHSAAVAVHCPCACADRAGPCFASTGQHVKGLIVTGPERSLLV